MNGNSMWSSSHFGKKIKLIVFSRRKINFDILLIGFCPWAVIV